MKKMFMVTIVACAVSLPFSAIAATSIVPGAVCHPQDTSKYERGNYDFARFLNNDPNSTNVICPIMRHTTNDPAITVYVENGQAVTTQCKVIAKDLDGSPERGSTSFKTISTVTNATWAWTASDVSWVTSDSYVYLYCEMGSQGRIHSIKVVE